MNIFCKETYHKKETQLKIFINSAKDSKLKFIKSKKKNFRNSKDRNKRLNRKNSFKKDF
jgi:hypothetical protein